jgi:hypothetical protein
LALHLSTNYLPKSPRLLPGRKALSVAAANIARCVIESAGHEFDRVVFFIDGAVKVFTRLPDFDVCLVHPLRRAAQLQMLTGALVDFRGLRLSPMRHRRVTYVESTLTRHFFNIAIRKSMPTVSSDARENELVRVMVPLEGRGVMRNEYSR